MFFNNNNPLNSDPGKPGFPSGGNSTTDLLIMAGGIGAGAFILCGMLVVWAGYCIYSSLRNRATDEEEVTPTAYNLSQP